MRDDLILARVAKPTAATSAGDLSSCEQCPTRLTRAGEAVLP